MFFVMCSFINKNIHNIINKLANFQYIKLKLFYAI